MLSLLLIGWYDLLSPLDISSFTATENLMYVHVHVPVHLVSLLPWNHLETALIQGKSTTDLCYVKTTAYSSWKQQALTFLSEMNEGRLQ